jgi:hypothetical protein
MDVVAQGNLFAFFYDRVHAARSHQGDPVSEETEHYLVHLLVEFQRTPHLVESGGQRVDERPLAIRLLESRHQRPGERFRELKHLADSTLYVLGFFAESLQRGAVDLRYYRSLARTAYRDLAVLGGLGRGEGKDPVFHSLDTQFPACVEILTEVKEEARPRDQEMLALYAEWLTTGSERAAQRLRELGVPLGRDAGRSVQ